MRLSTSKVSQLHTPLFSQNYQTMLTLFLVLLGAFSALTLLVMRAPIPLDELEITRRVQSGAARRTGPFLRLINFPGYPPQVLIIGLLLVVVPFLFGFKWLALMQAFVGLGVGLAAAIVKRLVQRPRPAPRVVTVTHILDGGLQSYPAGHCADYLARFGFIIYLLAQLPAPSWWVWLTMVVLGIFIAFVGLARIYSGEHWLTDVIGGYLLGAIWLWLTIFLYHWTDAQDLVARYL